ncbi:unnamed protein product [Phytomonas sp. Hart1]|nr:unnamed protein product [Phytomonas sp. Hart1]|eukprot:CCW71179.1 unnamed protein product [Phytomonas sp. isolate Hart1]
MFRFNPLLRDTAFIRTTLSQWARQLAVQAAALPSWSGPPSSSSASTRALWEDVVHAIRHGFAMKETDTLYSVVRCLLAKGYSPPLWELWPQMAKWLLMYADVESTSVLCYPGEPEATLRAEAASAKRPFPPNRLITVDKDFASSNGDGMVNSAKEKEPDDDGQGYFIFPSREMLLLTGGVVPLSARVPCADGTLLRQFLEMFCRYVREEILPKVNPFGGSDNPQGEGSRDEIDKVYTLLSHMNESLFEVIQTNLNTIRIHLVLEWVAQYVALLWDVDHLLGELSQQNFGLDEEPHAKPKPNKESQPPTSLLLAFVRSFVKKELNSSTSALGARLALCGVAFTIHRMVTSEGNPTSSFRGGAEFDFSSLLSFPGYLISEVSFSERRLQFDTLSVAVRGVLRHYERSAFDPKNAHSAMRAWPPLASLLAKVYDFVDVSLQYNANQNNPLNIAEEGEQQLRQDVLLTWVRCLRVETESPNDFLRDSMSIVERSAPSLGLEAELIAGKVALFDYFELLEEGKQTIYNDILTSLRHLIELRPRANTSYAMSPSDGIFFDDEGQQNEQEGEEQIPVEDLIQRSSQSSPDNEMQEIIQASHQLVIKALCDSHQMQCINDAYNIVITHKYQGLIITKEIIRPLVEALSRYGDCRVFNLVDLCVLYSNNQIDMPIITGLFRTCAVAGDHYRARTFLKFLQDIVPGFLIKATPDIIDFLKELKVLPPEPYHLFTSDEEKLEKSTVGFFSDVLPREIPDLAPSK